LYPKYYKKENIKSMNVMPEVLEKFNLENSSEQLQNSEFMNNLFESQFKRNNQKNKDQSIKEVI